VAGIGHYQSSGSGSLRHNSQIDKEGRAFVFAAFHPAVAVVQAHDLLGDKQAQTRRELASQALAGSQTELVE
jgi:hypothetical protein